jgi:hypothetical protein
MENRTFDCDEDVPSTAELYGNLQTEQKLIFIVPIALCILSFVIYVANVRAALKHERRETKGNVVALFTIYPVSLKQKKHKPQALEKLFPFRLSLVPL